MTRRQTSHVGVKGRKESSVGLTHSSADGINTATWDRIFIERIQMEVHDNGKIRYTVKMGRLDSPGQRLQFGIRFRMTDVDNQDMTPIVKEVELDTLFLATGYDIYT